MLYIYDVIIVIIDITYLHFALIPFLFPLHMLHAK